jgi:hypothetical protein
MRAAWIVFAKEFLENLRDRRTLGVAPPGSSSPRSSSRTCATAARSASR